MIIDSRIVFYGSIPQIKYCFEDSIIINGSPRVD